MNHSTHLVRTPRRKVIDDHPKLIEHFAKVIMRAARRFGADAPALYCDMFTDKQQRLIAEYIRNHRKRTKEIF